MSVGILLVHGYSGSPDNLAPLAEALEQNFGKECPTLLRLSGHGDGAVPAFNRQDFTENVIAASSEILSRGKKLILLGHSTGGAIALAALARSGIAPDLFILASVPKKIDGSYLARWSLHRSGLPEIPFSSIAAMISLVNAAGSQRFDKPFPAIVVHGDQDSLVPPETAFAWEQGTFAGPIRTIMIPRGEHDLFRGSNAPLAVDAVIRAVKDVQTAPEAEDLRIADAIAAVEPEALAFLRRSPFSVRHVGKSPAGHTVGGRMPMLASRVLTEPVFANIEITTRCNLKCTYCARTMRGTASADMHLDTFKTVLGLLPHAYRITLVGLGETLMHPGVAEMVRVAASAGSRVALVTNAMLLDEVLSRELLDAGLASIAFSIDGPTQESASTVRPGTDLNRVAGNIRKFMERSRSVRPVSTAVFSAVSRDTVSTLPQLVELAAELGVHVLMMSDLNFRENLDRSLWRSASQETTDYVRTAVTTAFKKNLPVLSVHGLEELGLWQRYRKFLLLPPEQLLQRSVHRTWCCSPWQTVPVNVRGEVSVCDCQPELIAGSLLKQPLAVIWNGEVMTEQRIRMLSDDPPEACRICPRF